jgi:hypothetical protein
MWLVKYYLTGGTLVSRRFPSLAAATNFTVYDICCWEVKEFYLIDEV